MLFLNHLAKYRITLLKLIELVSWREAATAVGRYLRVAPSGPLGHSGRPGLLLGTSHLSRSHSGAPVRAPVARVRRPDRSSCL